MTGLSVHIVHKPEGQALERLEADLPGQVVLTYGKGEAPPETKVLVSGRPGRRLLDACPQLETLIVPYAGIPPETLALLGERGDLAVYNLHHNAASVAEAAIALLLAAAKAVVPMDSALRSYDWRPRFRPDPAIMLEGRHALVLGYGAIGRRVARLCRGLGMSVSAVRRSGVVAQRDEVEVHGVQDLARLLPSAQVLMVCLPHTAQTEGLISEEMLGLLPAGAVLVNIARAAIIDEEALFWSLSTGHLHSAGLDVWYRYPKGEKARTNTAPSAQPFEVLQNVVMSPHRSGHAGEIEVLRMVQLRRVIDALAAGEPAPNRVDCGRGY